MEIIEFHKNHPDLKCPLSGCDTLDEGRAGVSVLLSQDEYEFLKNAARNHHEAIQQSYRNGCCDDDFALSQRKTYLRIDGAMRQIANFDWPKNPQDQPFELRPVKGGSTTH